MSESFGPAIKHSYLKGEYPEQRRDEAKENVVLLFFSLKKNL